jgi:hypothetical protein
MSADRATTLADAIHCARSAHLQAEGADKELAKIQDWVEHALAVQGRYKIVDSELTDALAEVKAVREMMTWELQRLDMFARRMGSLEDED